jgi:Fe-S-cluster containining protein
VSDPERPTAEALDAAFHGEVRARAASLRGLPSNLRLARRFDLEPLDATALVDDTQGQVPDCRACDDNCCRGAESRIVLRLSDLARLIDAGLEHAIDVAPVTPPETYARFPELKAHEARETNRRFPALKQREDGRCVFLDDEQRCGIYVLRPLRCRRFPYRVSDDKTRVTYASRCQSRRAGSAAERVELFRAAVDNYNEKLKDLLLLEHGRPALERLGIARYLPVID